MIIGNGKNHASDNSKHACPRGETSFLTAEKNILLGRQASSPAIINEVLLLFHLLQFQFDFSYAAPVFSFLSGFLHLQTLNRCANIFSSILVETNDNANIISVMIEKQHHVLVFIRKGVL